MVVIAKRCIMGIMIFLQLFFTYMMRVNLSINILAMSKHPSSILPGSPTHCNYSSEMKGHLLGAYFYGYMCTPLPGGLLAEKFGGRRVIGYSSLMAAILTPLIPLVGSCNTVAIFLIRFFIGFVGGVIYPCCHYLISKWAPHEEKGKFLTSFVGGTVGTAFTWSVSGIIIEHFGWTWVFYAEGLSVALFTIVWFLLVADTPSQHSTITPEELEYINNSLGSSVSTKKKKKIPCKQLTTSGPLWALVFLHYGSSWGMFFLLTDTPIFMNEALGFTIAKTGFLSSMSYVGRMIAGIVFGIVVDMLRKRGRLTVTQIRKLFCIFSHFLPGVLFLALGFIVRQPIVSVAAIWLAQTCTGASLVTNAINGQDLAPNFAATISGIINFFGTTTGVLAPMTVGYFTKSTNTMEDWKWIFTIGASSYLLSVVIFWLFGSGEIQKWNNID